MDLSHPSEVVLSSVRGSVLRVLARTDRQLSGREVAAIAGDSVGYRRVSQVLAELAEAGIVERVSHPPAYLYRLNRDHVAAEPIMILADLRGRLLSRIADEANSWPHRVEALWLFGSAARGDGTVTSDIDLLAVTDPSVDRPLGALRSQLDELANHITLWTGNDCQLIDYDLDELQKLVDQQDPFIASLRHEAIAVVGHSPNELMSGLEFGS